jgi:hypothetical protein
VIVSVISYGDGVFLVPKFAAVFLLAVELLEVKFGLFVPMFEVAKCVCLLI